MGNISFETFQKAVNSNRSSKVNFEEAKSSFTSPTQRKTSPSLRTVSFETFKKAIETDAANKKWKYQQESAGFLSEIKKTNIWTPAEEMDRYIQLTKDRAVKDTANKSVYDEILKDLESRKTVYSNFTSADEYNTALQESEWREKYKGYSYDQIQQLLAARGGRGTGDDAESAWLKNYGMAVGYGDEESYDKHLAKLDRKIEENNSTIQNIQFGTQVGGYSEEADRVRTLEEENQKIEVEKATLARAKSVLVAQKKLDAYKDQLSGAADFAEKSQYDFKEMDPIYRAVNGDNVSATKPSDDQNLATRMEPQEAKVYNYLFKTQGKKAATAYFDDLRPILNERANTEQATAVKEFADKNWFTATVANIGTLGSQLVDGTVGGAKKLVGSLTGDYEKNWSQYDKLTTFTNTVRTDTAQDLIQATGWDGAGFVYNTVMSIADMGVALGVGGIVGKVAGGASAAVNSSKVAKGVTQFIMSSEAASHTMTDARARGLSGPQIAALGVVSACIETATEKLPLDNLFGEGAKGFKFIAKQVTTEGAEEAISSVLNTFADEVIAGNESAIKQQIGELMASGMSYQDAAQQVLVEKAKEVGLDALGGALSGGIMGGGAAAISRLANVYYSVPKKYTGTMEQTREWTSNAFSKLKNGTDVKGLGTVTLDADSMNDAIGKTKNADQAVAFAAINDIMKKGKVTKSKLGTAAKVHTVAMLNGNAHPAMVALQKKTDTDWSVARLVVDGDVVYDASQNMEDVAASVDNKANRITMEEFANRDSDVWRNVEYEDEATKTQITQQIHDAMVAEGSVVHIADEDVQKVSQSFPDLRDMKKKERLPLLKEAIANVKDHLRQFLSTFKGENFELDVNGKVLEAKLYSTGINEVLEKITQQKATMLYSTKEIFQNARYLYSTPDYNGDPNVYRWNYFYTPVQIGEDTVGVRIAVRDISQGQNHSPESQIYNWGIKKNAPLGGTQPAVSGSSRGASSDASSDNMVAQVPPTVKNDYAQNSLENTETVDTSILELEQTALDRSFLSMDERERADFVQRFEKATGTRVVFDETLDAGGKYENKVITVNPNTDTPMTVIIHELTHHIEKTGDYRDFRDFVFFESQIFKEWMRSKGHRDIAEFAEAVIKARDRTEHPLGQNGANAGLEAREEILANFVGEKLIRDARALEELLKGKPRWFEGIRNFFANLIRHFRSTPMERELHKMEQLFAKAVQAAKNVSETDTPAKHIVITMADGRKYVKADRQVIFGDDPAKWEDQIIDYVNDVVRGGQDLTIPTQEGDVLTITGRTAWKLGYRNDTLTGGKISDATYRLKGDAAGHIDELSEVSKFRTTRPNFKPNRKTAFGQDGFDYRYAYFLDKDGSYYRLTLSVGIDGNVKTVYNIGEIKKVPFPLTAQRPKAGTTPSNNTVSQSDTAVNTHSMQNGAKYSVSSVTERESVPEVQDEQGAVADDKDLLGYTEEQLRAEVMRQREELQQLREQNRRNKQENPLTIASSSEEDANTTPDLQRSRVHNRKGDGQSAFAKNLQGADIFDDHLKSLAATDTLISRYDRITNRETMEAANEKLNEGGASYVNEWFAKQKGFTEEDIAAGFILMSRYQRVGDHRNEVLVAEKLRLMGTKSGQAVQIFSILGRMTPEGMLLYAQKTLSDAYEDMCKSRSVQWVRENKSKFQLTDEDCEYILVHTLDAARLPEGRDKDIALANIAGRIQSKIPHERGQAFKALQRIGMLLNPLTILRNTYGNISVTGHHVLADFIGAGIDKATSAVFKTGWRTKSVTQFGSVKAMKKGAGEAFDDYRRSMAAGYKIDTRQGNEDRLKIEGRGSNNFNEHHTGKSAAVLNALSRAMNALDRTTSFLLELGDRPFFEMWFMNSLEGQMKVNHVTEPTAVMIEIATQEALQRTWQDDNAMTKMVSAIKKASNLQFGDSKGLPYGPGDVCIKFAKTPANLTKAIVEFSPFGLVKALSADLLMFSRAVKKGQATPQMQHHFVKNLANAISGSFITALMATAIGLGLVKVTGEEDEDKDVASFERYVKGYQPYSVKIGGKYFSYDWMQPTSAQIAMIADFMQDKENAEMTGEKLKAYDVILDAVSTAGKTLFQQSFMTSVQGLFESDNLFENFLNLVLSDTSVLAPQMLSKVAATFDPTVRNTFEYGDSVQTAINKALYKIPGARNTLAPSVDVLGNEKKQAGGEGLGGILVRAVNNFFNPANVSKGYESAAGDEIYRLYQTTGQASVIPSQAPNYVEKNGGKLTLDSHQKAEYQKVSGKMSAEAVEGLLKTEQYAVLSDVKKAEVLSAVYEYSGQVAKNTVTDVEMSDEAAKAHEIISQGVPVYQYFLLKKAANTDGKVGINQDEARAVLDNSSLTRVQKEIMWNGFDSSWKSNPYKKRYY